MFDLENCYDLITVTQLTKQTNQIDKGCSIFKIYFWNIRKQGIQEVGVWEDQTNDANKFVNIKKPRQLVSLYFSQFAP